VTYPTQRGPHAERVHGTGYRQDGGIGRHQSTDAPSDRATPLHDSSSAGPGIIVPAESKLMP
jgi:hypothetical protein